MLQVARRPQILLLLDGDDDLIKGAGVKYKKRELTGKLRPKYRYWYNVPGKGLVSSDGLKKGQSFKAEHDGKEGHYHVEHVDHESGSVHVHHDESGEKKIYSKEEFAKKISQEHEGEQLKALVDGYTKRMDLVEKARRADPGGARGYVARAEKELLRWSADHMEALNRFHQKKQEEKENPPGRYSAQNAKKDKEKLQKISKEKDGWKKVLEMRGEDIGAFHAKYEAQAQDLWDSYGLVLAPLHKEKLSSQKKNYAAPEKYQETMDEGHFNNAMMELSGLNRAFNVKEVFGATGVTVSFLGGSKGGEIHGSYTNGLHNIILHSGSGHTFTHELFHALDYFHGEKRGDAASERENVSASPSESKADPEYKQYLANKQERFARIMEQFSTYHINRRAYSRYPGYWSHEFIHKNVESIVQLGEKVGVKFKPDFLESVKSDSFVKDQKMRDKMLLWSGKSG